MTTKTIARIAAVARRLSIDGEVMLISVDAEWTPRQQVVVAARGEHLPQRHVSAAGLRHGWGHTLAGHTTTLGTTEREAMTSLRRLATQN